MCKVIGCDEKKSIEGYCEEHFKEIQRSRDYNKRMEKEEDDN